MTENFGTNGKEHSGTGGLAGSPRLLDRVRVATRRLHYSIRTEDAYVQWAKRFILFHGKRHPDEMGEEHIVAFLNHLAAERNAAASTQNQALPALLFLYKAVLERPVEWFSDKLTPGAASQTLAGGIDAGESAGRRGASGSSRKSRVKTAFRPRCSPSC